MCNQIDFKALREKSGLTLSQLADLAGCSVLQVAHLENDKNISVGTKERIMSVLLQVQEDGVNSEIKIWRDRALLAEEKLSLLKESMVGWIKKI